MSNQPHDREMEGSHVGNLSREDLVAVLNELLEAERAGARVTLHSASEAQSPSSKSLFETIQRDEAKWCGVLSRAIVAMNGKPSPRTGAFYDKAMAITNLSDRLIFLNRGQAWVIRKLREVIPKINKEDIHQDLADMCLAHERNIELASQHVGGTAATAAGIVSK
jgi:nitronate monooxygenase